MPTFCWVGDGMNWGVGNAMVGGYDLTGDGVDDIGIGAPGTDGDQTQAGGYYVLPGGGF